MGSTEGTLILLFGIAVDTLLAKGVTTGEDDVGLVVRREEEFEANGASIGHDLIVEGLFKVCIVGWSTLFIRLRIRAVLVFLL